MFPPPPWFSWPPLSNQVTVSVTPRLSRSTPGPLRTSSSLSRSVSTPVSPRMQSASLSVPSTSTTSLPISSSPSRLPRRRRPCLTGRRKLDCRDPFDLQCFVNISCVQFEEYKTRIKTEYHRFVFQTARNNVKRSTYISNHSHKERCNV